MLLGFSFQARANGELTATLIQVQAEDFPQTILIISVLDEEGRPIKGLEKTNFEVFEDGRQANLTRVEEITDSEVGIAVAMAIDVSDSMSENPLREAKEASSGFIDRMASTDQAAILSFADTVKIEQEFTGDKEKLGEAVSGLAAGGKTALYDAAFKVVDVASGAPIPRRIALLLSDGQEYGGASISSRSDALRKADQEGEPVYTIALGNNADRSYLEKLAALTGGRAFVAPSPDELEQLYDNLGEMLRSQYILTVDSQVAADGKEHQIKLQVNYQGKQAQAEGTFMSSPVAINLDDLIEGQVVEKILPLEPEIETQGEIEKVEYYLDGTLASTAKEAPYTFKLNPRLLSPEDHTLKVVAYDTDGNKGVLEISFTVPIFETTIELPSLQDGQRVDQVLKVEPEIKSQGPITKVEYYLDGSLVLSVDQAPYTFELDPMTLAPEEHTFRVVVHDEADSLHGTEATFTVPPIEPTVTLLNLKDGKTLTDEVSIEPEVISQTPVAKVEYYLNEALKFTAQKPPFRYLLNPESLERGDHALTVVVYDTAGSKGEITLSFHVAGIDLNLSYLFLVAGLALALFGTFAVLRARKRSQPAIGTARTKVRSPQQQGQTQISSTKVRDMKITPHKLDPDREDDLTMEEKTTKVQKPQEDQNQD